MTLIRVEKIEPKRKSKWGKKRIIHLKCDFCQIEYQRGFTQNCFEQKFHFCCYLCCNKAKQNDGVLAKQLRESNLEKFGTEHVFQSDHFKERAKQTWLQTLGVDNPLKTKEIHQKGIFKAASNESREKALETFKKHFGDTNPLKRNLENVYGVINSSQIVFVLEKRKQTYVKRLGVENPSQSSIIKDKKKETCRKNFGVDWPMQNPSVLSMGNKRRRISSIVQHWKTLEDLVCVGSYEVAFVNWCTAHQFDFDWQIKFETPLLTSKGNTSVYIIDAFLKTGPFENTWIEIKGFMTEGSRKKWEWFQTEHSNSQLWSRHRLRELGILP